MFNTIFCTNKLLTYQLPETFSMLNIGLKNIHRNMNNLVNECNSVNLTAALFALATTTTMQPSTISGSTTTTTLVSNVSRLFY
jgi:hypothetical protein